MAEELVADLDGLLSFEDPSEIFERLECVGEGSFGSVYKGRNKATDEYVALKIMPLDSKAGLADIKKEILIVASCSHPHVVKYHGSFLRSAARELWLALEYCAGGSAADILRVTKRGMSPAVIASILGQTLRALLYFHSLGKIHRDIKGANILLCEDGKCKLADFGVATADTGSAEGRHTFIGTPYWMAPEIINDRAYDGRADIWSVGITAIELAEQEPPLMAHHPMRALFLIRSQPPPTLKGADAYPPELNDFIAQCLTADPALRPTAAQMLLHPFIAAGVSPGRTRVAALVAESNRIQDAQRAENRSRLQVLLSARKSQQSEAGGSALGSPLPLPRTPINPKPPRLSSHASPSPPLSDESFREAPEPCFSDDEYDTAAAAAAAAAESEQRSPMDSGFSPSRAKGLASARARMHRLNSPASPRHRHESSSPSSDVTLDSDIAPPPPGFTALGRPLSVSPTRERVLSPAAAESQTQKIADLQYIHERLLDENEQLRQRLLEADTAKEMSRQEATEAGKVITALRKRLGEQTRAAVEGAEDAARALARMQTEHRQALDAAQTEAATLRLAASAAASSSRTTPADADASAAAKAALQSRLERQQLASRVMELETMLEASERANTSKAATILELTEEISRLADSVQRLSAHDFSQSLRLSSLTKSLADAERKEAELLIRVEMGERALRAADLADAKKAPEFSAMSAYLQGLMVESAGAMTRVLKELRADNENLAAELRNRNQ